jgi:hypothetical protein
MQDPIIQMQQQELQLKMQEFQLKQQKQQIDAAAKADQLEIEKSRIEAQMQIAAMQVSATAAVKKISLLNSKKAEGLRMGIDAAKHKRRWLCRWHSANQQKQVLKRRIDE